MIGHSKEILEECLWESPDPNAPEGFMVTITTKDRTQIYSGTSNGLCTTHKDQVNQGLDFIKS